MRGAFGAKAAALDRLKEGGWLAPVAFVLLLAVYHFLFGPFFPTKNGTLGHDYGRILPDLLDGYYWAKNNGLFEPFWFTPAFCGGEPALGAPESALYSVAQMLTLFTDPLTSVYLQTLLFAALGFWGFYFLLRGVFATGREAAILGGALFMFNGFYIHRMMIGHVAFHAVMLIPWATLFLLRPQHGMRLQDGIKSGALTGLVMAYCVYSGMVHLFIPFALAVLGMIALRGMAGAQLPNLVPRALFAALIGLGLSAAKLTASLLYLQNFSRSDYALPGIASAGDELQLLFSSLFISPPDIAEKAAPLLENLEWELGRHEWEYGMTLIPLFLMLAGGAMLAIRAVRAKPRFNPAALLWGVVLAVILAIPLAVNFYTPEWNAFLKQLPVIKSSLYMPRWFTAYIPLIALLAALSLETIPQKTLVRKGVLVVSLAALVAFNASQDRTFYREQPYRPDAVVNAWRAVKEGVEPRIREIAANLDQNGQIGLTLDRNDMLTRGGSQLACYNPIFGYRLERFPLKTLHLGPVFAANNGVLNVKNPACYLYGDANNCAPGDHFTTAQMLEADAFVNYRPYPFNFSAWQKAANAATLGTLSLLVVLLAVTLAGIFRRGKR